MECLQLDVQSDGTDFPSDDYMVAFPGAYRKDDPGLLINIWDPVPLASDYVVSIFSKPDCQIRNLRCDKDRFLVPSSGQAGPTSRLAQSPARLLKKGLVRATANNLHITACPETTPPNRLRQPCRKLLELLSCKLKTQSKAYRLVKGNGTALLEFHPDPKTPLSASRVRHLVFQSVNFASFSPWLCLSSTSRFLVVSFVAVPGALLSSVTWFVSYVPG